MKKTVSMALMHIFRKERMKGFYELNKSQWLSLSELKEIQNVKFIRLMRHCRENVPYYKGIESFHNVNSLKDITGLPLLTKKIIMKNQDNLKAVNYPQERFAANSTSGSTGETLKFYKDRVDNMGLGIFARNNMWTGWLFGEKEALLWGSHYDISKAAKLLNRVKNYFSQKKLYLSSYDMTENDMFDYHGKINKYKPALLTGYPSGLYSFAKFLNRKGLHIYRPKGIICSGETLYEFQRQEIESVFKCKVYNRYGSREFATMAHQCEKNEGLHINSEHVVVEILNESGCTCKPGELGEIVVTDLDNYVFPFVRYRIGDIGRLSANSCSCGRGLPLIESTEGRVFDIVIGTNGNAITGNFWTILLRTYVDGVVQFQVIQEHKDRLLLNLIVNESFNDNTKEKIIKEIHVKCGDDMNVDIEIMDKIPLTSSGKHKFVISNVSPFVQ